MKIKTLIAAVALSALAEFGCSPLAPSVERSCFQHDTVATVHNPDGSVTAISGPQYQVPCQGEPRGGHWVCAPGRKCVER